MSFLRSRLRPHGPAPVPGAAVHRRRGPHAWARHRRQHRDLQRGQRRAAEAAALRRRRPARRRVAHRARDEHPAAESVTRHLLHLPREGRVFEDIGMWDNTSVSVTGTGEPERIEALLVTDGTLAGAARAAGTRPTLHADDDSPAAPERVHAGARLLAAQVRRRSRVSSAVARRRRHAARNHRRAARRDSSSSNSDPQIVLPFQLDRAKVFVGNFSFRHRAAEAGRRRSRRPTPMSRA